MKITPLDIQQQQFKPKMFRGLDPDEVDSFLQMIAQEMENLLRENNDLKLQQRKMTADLDTMAQQERILRETIITAQKVTEDMKANAQKEAHLIISEAEVKGEKILQDAERTLANIKNDIQELRRQKMQFEVSFKAVLEKHFKMLSIGNE